MEKLAVSLDEAEKLVSISRFTLRRMIKRGTLKVARVGRKIIAREEDAGHQYWIPWEIRPCDAHAAALPGNKIRFRVEYGVGT